MDFPDFVPPSVQEHISNRLYGDKVENQGLIYELELVERQLINFEQSIQTQIPDNNPDTLDSLRKQQLITSKHKANLTEDIECLQSLAFDLRMSEAYQILVKELTEEKQQRDFIYAAWSAKLDYSSKRKILNQALELKGQIANVASNLASLIRNYESLNVNSPDEFYSIPQLLRQTDNSETQGNNFHMWRSMRGHVLGDSYPNDIRETIKYAWGVAPSLPALLNTVSNAAQNFTPAESGMIGDAIKSRQHSEKTEYLRAFANRLIQVHHINITPTVMRIMAIAGSVALNLPNIELTYDYVRKILKAVRHQ